MRTPLARPAPGIAPGSTASLRFIFLMAFLVSVVAFGIDMMLASLPDIGAELSPADPDRAQLVMGVFFLSLGVSTLIVGPLLDAFGRRPVILGGLVLYALGAALSWMAPNLTLMLLGRALMGFAAAAPRVGVMAVIRDRFEGRQMAATTSLVMTIFTLVPGVAPILGAWVADLFGWRGVFAAFILFGAAGFVWFFLQQPETLKTRSPLRLGAWLSQMGSVFRTPPVLRVMALQVCIFAPLYALLTAGPAIFIRTYGWEAAYPYIFGSVSLSGAASSFFNAKVVERLGMVLILRWAVIGYGALAFTMTVWIVVAPNPAAFLVLMFAGFFVLGFTVGNSQALAMQPLGAIAGVGAATITAVTTLGSGVLSIPIAYFADGNPLPLMASIAALTAIAAVLTIRLTES
ncbi:MAG: MFS transporter [Shimia sp.]